MRKIKNAKNSLLIITIALVGLLTIATGLKLHPAKPARATTTYIVTNNNDAGTGSLRQAILDANANAGADVITFSTGMSIQPLSQLPNITDPVEINGYTGSPGGATANTAVSPAPFNGTLTIEIDGTNAGSADGLRFDFGSQGSSARGLTINRFAQDGVKIGADNITVQGNYIGTSTDGMSALGNSGGIRQAANDSDNLQIGGTSPAERNIISGNTDNGSSPNTDSDNWVYEGNYIGLAADGVSAIPNAQIGGAGALSLDNSNGHRVGGSTDAAKNVISGNNSIGIAPANSDDLIVTGNYIGTDYTGTVAIANGGNAISLSDSLNVQIGGTSGVTNNGNCTGECNLISGNTEGGVAINSGNSGVSVYGNYIGTDVTGTQPLGNGNGIGESGVRILGSSNCNIGSSMVGARNIISANDFGIVILGIAPFGGSPAANNVVQNNYIGTTVNGNVKTGMGNLYAGVLFLAAPEDNLIGGATAGTGNLIAGNGSGIVNAGFELADVDLNNSFIGNSIYNNTGGPVSQLGIDLADTIDGSSFTNTGVTANDDGDTDESTNHYLNFPVLTSATSTDGTATITYDLDINDTEAGATGYRVEFFANDTADPSGHGQGQTYLGSDTVSGDVTARQATITLPAGLEGTKYISATTTMTDDSTDGFGHTSEFAADIDANLVAKSGVTPSSASLASTGQNAKLIAFVATMLILTGATSIGYAVRKKK